VKSACANNFAIVIDTREKTPWRFDVPTVHGTLHAGDYSVMGLENIITVERKSLDDLLACVGRERNRFKRELQRLRSYRYRSLVIESTADALHAGNWRSGVHPNAALGSLASWQAEYHVPIWLGGSPNLCARFVQCYLRHTVRALERECPMCRGGQVAATGVPYQIRTQAEGIMTMTTTLNVRSRTSARILQSAAGTLPKGGH
jgi:hypothetical protein